MSITAIVLAAGLPLEEGTPRALLEIRGATRLTHLVNCARAAGVAAISVVIGPPDGNAIKAKLPPGAGFTWNPLPARGVLSSVQAGIANLPRGTLSVLVWPVENATVQPASVRAILDGEPGKIVVPRYRRKQAYPIRIPRQQFATLMALPSDGSLAAFLKAQAESVIGLDVDDVGSASQAPASDAGETPALSTHLPPEARSAGDLQPGPDSSPSREPAPGAAAAPSEPEPGLEPEPAPTPALDDAKTPRPERKPRKG